MCLLMFIACFIVRFIACFIVCILTVSYCYCYCSHNSSCFLLFLYCHPPSPTTVTPTHLPPPPLTYHCHTHSPTQVTVLVRSMLLRGFDRDIVEKVQVHLEAGGTRVLVGLKPVRVDKVENGQLKVGGGR